MIRPFLVTIVGGLALAAPAGAVTGGYGASAALHRGGVLALPTPVAARQRHTCQKNDQHAGRAGKSFYPVACEQPPRTGANIAGQLSQVAASALNVLG